MKTKSMVFFLGAALILLSGCAKKSSGSGNNTAVSNGNVANVSEVTTVEIREHKAPNFSWQDPSGNKTDFASVAGKITLVNFWATWCGPCKHELPDLISLSKEYESRGVKVIGISADVGTDVTSDVKSFVQEEGIPYLVLIANDDIKEAFGNVSMLPTSFVIDKEGNILETMIGARSKEQFAAAIDKHL
jgi:thiol-disulfide isomerase/thioredoxin